MIVISRQRDETLMIGEEVEILVCELSNDAVRLQFSCGLKPPPGHPPVPRNKTLRAGERVELVPGIACDIVHIGFDRVRLGITAPEELAVHRREVWEAIRREENYQKASQIRPEDLIGIRSITPPGKR